ncbi:MAG: hypothetical protein KAT48_13130 [Bacteroidales bacterium]|nr:hypothetical protein [Bacteroidales bacterium]
MKKLFVLITFAAFAIATVFFHSCQKEETTIPVKEQGTLMLKTTTIPELNLTYPSEAYSNQDFDIVFSSTCGKVKIERGYVLVEDVKVYNGLTCDSPGLEWEEITSGGYSTCAGSTHTENWAEAGTYVYRAALHHKAKNKSDCDDCDSFTGNEFECFMITVVDLCEWYGETAWADGDRYVEQGNWATYTTYQSEDDVILYAGQTIAAGTVTFSSVDGNGDVTITIMLNSNVRLKPDDQPGEPYEPVKIQGYTSPPSGNPAPGQFTTYKGDQLIITVPYYMYYGIHLDVEICE